MPKERVCANSETVSADIRPVSDLENRQVGGKALCCDRAFAEGVEKIDALRDRQQRFLATLPTEAGEAIDASFHILHPDLGNYMEGFEEALHLSHTLAVLIEKGDLDEESREREAATFVARRVAGQLQKTRNQLDYLSHVLGNPKRLEREGSPIAWRHRL